VRKSKKPRLKKYYDAAGKLQTVEGYRYRCDCMSSQEMWAANGTVEPGPARGA
jgi:hypothetical protein